jgi:RHS repeat-associated protein
MTRLVTSPSTHEERRGDASRARLWLRLFSGVAVAAGLPAACSGGHADPLGATTDAVLGGPATAIVVNTGTNAIGRLTQSGNSLVQAFQQYDALGRAAKVQHVIGNTSYLYATAFGYPQTSLGLCSSNACGPSGPPGSVTVSSTLPDGETVGYTYDAGGQQQSVTSTPSGGASQPVVAQVVRNARGQTVQVVYGDGTEQDHCYNDGAPCGCYSVSSGAPTCSSGAPPSTDLRLNGITSYATTSKAALQDTTYTFDLNGSVTSVSDNLTPSLSASYAYDSLDRLIAMTSNGTQYAYGYDNIGNLTTKEGAAQAYFPSGPSSVHPHAVSAAFGMSFNYDANGNLVSTTGASTNPAVTWNSENMPTNVVYGSATTQKFFLGESLWKKVVGATTTYYLPSLRVENGVAHKYYAGFAERDVDGTLKFYHGDHLGSSTLVTNASGTVVHRAAYMPYGGDRSTSNYTPAYTETFTPKYQFNFKEKEQDGTGLYDYGARLYSPATGRFLSADSLMSEQRYAYVNNNPLTHTDPTGHCPDWRTCLAQWNEKGEELALAQLKVTGQIAGLITGIDSRTAVNLFHAQNTPDRVESWLNLGAGLANTAAMVLTLGGSTAVELTMIELKNGARVAVVGKFTNEAEKRAFVSGAMKIAENEGDKGVVVVLAHGNASVAGGLTARQLVEKGVVQEGDHVIFASCSVGCGTNPIAQKLATAAKATVEAPTDKLAIQASGQTTVVNGGVWKDFVPGSGPTWTLQPAMIDRVTVTATMQGVNDVLQSYFQGPLAGRSDTSDLVPLPPPPNP